MDGLDGQAQQVRRVLAAEVGRVRHPSAPLEHFLADADDLPEDFDGEDLDGVGLPEQVVQEARLRRAALIVAASSVIDRCLDDLSELDFDDDGRPDPDEAADSFVFDRFPGRFRAAYDERFFRNVAVTAVTVAGDLADPDGGPAACIAEEIVRDAVIDKALGLCDMAGLGEPWIHPTETLLEDTDFEYLFDKDMDGIENDPALQAGLGIWVPDTADWFTPFNPDRVVHPYTETTPADRPKVHDLRRRLRHLDQPPAQILTPDVTDAATSLAGLEAGSEIVDLAREAARLDRDTQLWVPDQANPEESFAALTRAAASVEAGGGWLCWEPHEAADAVRTDPVVVLDPHRHFPVGVDTAWVDTAIGIGYLVAVPLGCVVSYRPDADVRRRWNARLQPDDRTEAPDQ